MAGTEGRGGCPDCAATTTVETTGGKGARVRVVHERTCPTMLRRAERAGVTEAFFARHRRVTTS